MLVHSETSTGDGVRSEAIAKAVRASGDTLLIVDGITSIGALPFKMDDWGVDIAITGSQKALMLPPGLGIRGAIRSRLGGGGHATRRRRIFTSTCRNTARAWTTATRRSPRPIRSSKRLGVSLKMIRDETIETIWKRTHTIAEAFRQGVQGAGHELFSKTPADSVTAVNYPAGMTDKEFRNPLKNKHNIHIAGGQGTMEGKIFRVNHMGYSDAYDALAVVAAIEHTLKALGKPVEFGAGVAAAQKVLSGLF